MYNNLYTDINSFFNPEVLKTYSILFLKLHMLKVKKGHQLCDGTYPWLKEHNRRALF